MIENEFEIDNQDDGEEYFALLEKARQTFAELNDLLATTGKIGEMWTNANSQIIESQEFKNLIANCGMVCEMWTNINLGIVSKIKEVSDITHELEQFSFEDD